MSNIGFNTKVGVYEKMGKICTSLKSWFYFVFGCRANTLKMNS